MKKKTGRPAPRKRMPQPKGLKPDPRSDESEPPQEQATAVGVKEKADSDSHDTPSSKKEDEARQAKKRKRFQAKRLKRKSSETKQDKRRKQMVLQNRMSITYDTTRTPRLSLNSILLAAILTVAFTMVSFVRLPLPDLISPLLSMASGNQAVLIYTLQLPVALFIGAFLGAPLGILAMLAYILTGLFLFPVFANGGGLRYMAEPGFSYFIGMLVGTGIAGIVASSAFKHRFRPLTSWGRLLFTACVSVLSVHMIGVLGLVILTCLGGIPSLEALSQYLLHFTLVPVLYDLGLTLTLFYFVRPLRFVFWTALY